MEPIGTANANFPAPPAVYQSAREGDRFSYTFTGLTPMIRYTVILHFAELYWTLPNQRRFNVSINGTPHLTNFDIAEMAGPRQATDTLFYIPADVNGKITINFTKGTVDQPTVNGIEIRANNG